MLSGCSTQKNTAATRSFHQTKVRYNIFFNGNNAYLEGLQAINNANQDDFSSILNLYPVSNHQAAEASASQMEKTIEKCRKCIKLHSIKAKPKPDPKKRQDPKYKLWLQQEEFNKEMGNVWIRLGEAEFHKGDFLGSIGTFNYVARHYTYDADMVARCGLWTARAYSELGWQYEAEDALSKVNVDALSRKNAPLYSAVSADILIKGGQYREAIPFLKIAVPNEKRSLYRPRFLYVLAQLYERTGNRAAAADAYKHVVRMSPAPEMEFSARMKCAQLRGKSGIKPLQRMARLAKNKDKLDQIYGAIGDIYMQMGDTTQALENYGLAIEKSTQAGMDKAAVLVKAADLYFERRDYVPAQPYYREATTIIPSEREDYPRLQKRSETLDELIVEVTAVELQDSLQHLASLSEEEQRKIVDKLIEDLIAAEKEAEEKAALAAREAQNSGLQGVDTRNMIGGGGQSADWYFYNPQLLRGGKQEFARRWGNRTLEDNWRRLSKTASASYFGGESSLDEDMDELMTDSLSSDSIAVVAAPETDTHKPEYYLQQIPKMPEDIAASDTIIAGALANMVYIYHSKLEDEQLADETLAELMRRYPTTGHLLDLYYMKYLDALKQNDLAGMQQYRDLIRTTFPGSSQATIVSDPSYFDRLRHMAVEQDSLYENTYSAYMHGAYREVKQNKQYAEQNYPLSPLMPRFLFLNAVAIARTEGQPAFIEALQDMVARYGETELGAMAKDFLAMMGQGMESQKGGKGSASLADLRQQSVEEEETEEMKEKQFSAERKTSSYVYFALAEGHEEADLNSLLYQTALFNFSQFLIRDFDLQKIPVFGTGMALRISGLESLDEALWYIGLTEKNTDLMAELHRLGADVIAITEENAALLHTRFTVEEYRAFLEKSQAKPQGKTQGKAKSKTVSKQKR